MACFKTFERIWTCWRDTDSNMKWSTIAQYSAFIMFFSSEKTCWLKIETDLIFATAYTSSANVQHVVKFSRLNANILPFSFYVCFWLFLHVLTDFGCFWLFLGVKFWIKKYCLCKRNDKYHVLLQTPPFFISAFIMLSGYRDAGRGEIVAVNWNRGGETEFMTHLKLLYVRWYWAKQK